MLLLIICAGVTCVFPLDLVKTRLQNQKVRVLSFSCGILVLIQYTVQYRYYSIVQMSRHENCANSYYYMLTVPSVDISTIHKE
jgi:hypothetical protein